MTTKKDIHTRKDLASELAKRIAEDRVSKVLATIDINDIDRVIHWHGYEDEVDKLIPDTEVSNLQLIIEVTEKYREAIKDVMDAVSSPVEEGE